MLHKILSQYLDVVESAVRRIENVHVERYNEEVLTSKRVNLRIRLRFAMGIFLS